MYPFFLTKRQAYFCLYRQSKRKQDLTKPSSSPLSIKATLHFGSLQQATTQSLYRSSFGDEMNVAPSFTDSSASRTKSSRPLLNLSKHSAPVPWPPVESTNNIKSRSANTLNCPLRCEFIFKSHTKYPETTCSSSEVGRE